MVRRRPCRICRKWFRPDARAGERQRVCSNPACQRERHRRACAEWRARNPDYDRLNRLVRRLVRERGVDALTVDPLSAIDWEVARDEIGLEPAVTIEEFGRLLVRWARDEIRA